MSSLLLICAVAVSFGKDVEGIPTEGLATDDVCYGDESSCSMSLRQLRGKQQTDASLAEVQKHSQGEMNQVKQDKDENEGTWWSGGGAHYGSASWGRGPMG